jgi:voltage-gated potassium channel
LVKVPDIEKKSIAGKTLLGLGITAVAFAIVTLAVVYYISHNFYVSAYYTISSLFDAVGINTVPALEAAAAPFTTKFDILMAISIIDGVAKTVAVGLALAALVEIMTGAGILSRLNRIEARRLKRHVIVCGYSGLAARICGDLSAKKANFVIIEKDEARVEMLRDRGYTVIDGDFAKEDVLVSAAIDKAMGIIFTARDDISNLLGVVTARHLNPKIKILSRVGNEDLMTKVQRAGAELCVVPEVLAGVEMGNYIRSRL